MGCYNFIVVKGVFGDMFDVLGMLLMINVDFGMIFGIGIVVYGFVFFVNGFIIDCIGGKKVLFIGGFGVVIVNLVMGWVIFEGYIDNLFVVFLVFYGFNMYF